MRSVHCHVAMHAGGLGLSHNTMHMDILLNTHWYCVVCESFVQCLFPGCMYLSATIIHDLNVYIVQDTYEIVCYSLNLTLTSTYIVYQYHTMY